MNVLRMVLSFSCAAISLLDAGAQAATGKTLYSFQGGSNGSSPLAGVYIDPNGNLFGTLSDFNSYSRFWNGVVYELVGHGGKWTQRTLHQFHPNQGDGAIPTGALIPDGTGALYGTTANGGIYGRQSGGGTVFKITPRNSGKGAWTESVLYSFNGKSEGGQTGGGLIFDAKNSLYLTHAGGGAASVGTVSMLTPPAQGMTAWTNTKIYTFQGGADGANPYGAPLVFDANGALYGTTYYGGGGTLCSSGSGCGTVYKLTPPSKGNGPWTETILYAFTGGADGALPTSNLVFDKNGNLFSTTQYGGTNNNGTVFELSPPTDGQTSWTETVIHSFGGSNDFAYSQGNTIMTSSGDLLVSARGGGQYNAGAIIQFEPPGGKGTWAEKTLYSFSGDNGTGPVGIALDSNGDIYGTTESLGNESHGVAFKIKP